MHFFIFWNTFRFICSSRWPISVKNDQREERSARKAIISKSDHREERSAWRAVTTCDHPVEDLRRRLKQPLMIHNSSFFSNLIFVVKNRKLAIIYIFVTFIILCYNIFISSNFIAMLNIVIIQQFTAINSLKLFYSLYFGCKYIMWYEPGNI